MLPGEKKRRTGTDSLTMFLLVAAAVLGGVHLLPATSGAADEGPALPPAVEECMDCHGEEGMEKTLENGEVLDLRIPAAAFVGSVHGDEGCEGCHEEVSIDSHPDEREIASRSVYRKELSEVCVNCHDPGDMEEGTPHAYLNALDEMPACSSCHDPHAVTAIAEWRKGVEESDYCLACHRQSLQGITETGNSYSLAMEEENLKNSVHMDNACPDCHSGFGKEAHEVNGFSSRREHTVAQAGMCRQCHDEMYEAFEGSIHHTIAGAGNISAPVCTDCHGFHSIGPAQVLETLAGVPCQRCHEEIFKAYEVSMHGQARGGGGHLEAPICADCHQSHGVQRASWSARLREACLACHESTLADHRDWLPNAGLHLESVTCPACHAPKARRRIDLALYDSRKNQLLTKESLRDVMVERGIVAGDYSSKEFNSVDLWNILRAANSGEGSPVSIAGHLEVRTGLEAHQLEKKGAALRDCDACHREGAEAFTDVTISIMGDGGATEHYSAADGVLTSPVSLGTVGGFYALGSTRIRILDLLLIAAVLGGMSVPALHMSARLVMKNREGGNR